jgi:drug/metabolite transporter (DMT)-like permease
MSSLTRTGSTTGLFAVAVTLGGSNFLAVSVSNRELDPFWGAGLRFTLAGLLFVIIALVLRLPWPRGRQLATTVGYGVLGISMFYALAYWALVRVSAGAATVVLALAPLVTLLLASAQGLERITRRAVAGSLLAVAGIAWMVLGDGGVTLPVGALLALLGATVCIGQSVIVGKSISANHPAITNAIALMTGAVGAPAAGGGQVVTGLLGRARICGSLRHRDPGDQAVDSVRHLVHVRAVPPGDHGPRRLVAR